MTKKESLLCGISACWSFASAMSAAFLNVYLYTYTKSLVVMIVYTVIQIAMIPIFFTVGGKFAQRFSFSKTLTVGILLAIAYLLLVLFGNQIFEVYPNTVYFVAVLVGMNNGFYWVAFHSLCQLVSTTETRMNFITNLGLSNNATKLIAPWLAAFLISQAPTDTQGYLNIFKIVLVIYFGTTLLAMQMKVPADKTPFTVMDKIFKSVKEDLQWRFTAVVSFLYGIRDSILLTLTGLLVYDAVGGVGSVYSRLLILFSLTSISSYVFIGKKINDQNRFFLLVLSGLMISSSAVVLVLFPNFYGALYFGVVDGLAVPIYYNIYQFDYMEVINKYRDQENMMGRVIAREAHLGIGRIVGMSFILACYFLLPKSLYMIVGIIVCSTAPLLTIAYIRNHKNKNKSLTNQ